MAKIMLCDDSKTMLRILEARLVSVGHEVVAKAMDGVEGYQAYLNSKPELVLLDVTMPNRDGRECLEDIIKHNPNAKVIMVSALENPDVVKECLKSGAKCFISKNSLQTPEAFSEVATQIENVLKAA